GKPDTTFTSLSGYGEGDYRGLSVASALHTVLRRMEQSYLDNNQRELEIVKHISLLSLDPLQFMMLKENGISNFTLPETLFDMDYPGHYMRRIKSVSVTLPCVVGNYTSIARTLRLMSSRIRYKPDDPENYKYAGPDDPRFIVNQSPTRAIALSKAYED